MTGWAFLARYDIKSRAHTLTSDLHKPEFAQRQDIVAGAVISHHLTHMLIKLLTVLRFIHINEVDHYDATHITQAQLPGYLVGSTKIHFECIAFLVGGSLGSVARIDVYDMKGLGMLDYHICTRLEGNCLSKR